MGLNEEQIRNLKAPGHSNVRDVPVETTDLFLAAGNLMYKKDEALKGLLRKHLEMPVKTAYVGFNPSRAIDQAPRVSYITADKGHQEKAFLKEGPSKLIQFEHAMVLIYLESGRVLRWNVSEWMQIEAMFPRQKKIRRAERTTA